MAKGEAVVWPGLITPGVVLLTLPMPVGAVSGCIANLLYFIRSILLYWKWNEVERRV